MQPSTDDLLIRQISALISATADAASTSSEHTPFMEARLYETLAAHCAEKQRLASICQKWSRKDATGIDLLVDRHRRIGDRAAKVSHADTYFDSLHAVPEGMRVGPSPPTRFDRADDRLNWPLNSPGGTPNSRLNARLNAASEL